VLKENTMISLSWGEMEAGAGKMQRAKGSFLVAAEFGFIVVMVWVSVWVWVWFWFWFWFGRAAANGYSAALTR
jgi:hypothetical protein